MFNHLYRDFSCTLSCHEFQCVGNSSMSVSITKLFDNVLVSSRSTIDTNKFDETIQSIRNQSNQLSDEENAFMLCYYTSVNSISRYITKNVNDRIDVARSCYNLRCCCQLLVEKFTTRRV